MKRKSLIIVVVFLVVTGVSFAEEEEGNWRIQGKAGIAGSIVSSYITPDVTVLYNPSFLSFGGGVKTFFGTDYGDAYIAPYGTIEMKWWYVNLGFSTQIKEPNETMANPSSDYTPLYFSTGVYPRIKAGPGWIVFGGNMDIIATASPVIEGDNFIETFFITIFGAAYSTLKLEAGIGYRVSQ